MTDSLTPEAISEKIKGRLYLWAHAVREAKTCLDLVKRVSRITSNYQIIEDEINELNQFVRKLPNHKEGSITSGERTAFVEAHTFPTFGEAVFVQEYMLQLAVVYFCQIFNDGYEDDGAVSNDKKFRTEHFEAIIFYLSFSSTEKHKFDTLVQRIKDARDGMIGHADGKCYAIKHGAVITTMNSPESITRDIDVDFWVSFMDKFYRSIFRYVNDKFPSSPSKFLEID